MDGRNYVDELLSQRAQTGRIQRYDIIYEDAINDYSVPFQLTTREFSEKILQLLNDDGVYIVNLIDIYDKGLFLGAIANTLQQSFPYVTVITEAAVSRSHRNTFVLVAAGHKLQLENLAQECRREGMLIWHLTEVEIETVKAKANHLVLTDDYAPIENLLAPVVLRRTAYDLAEHYFTQATKQFEEGQFDRSVDNYKKIIAKAPSMAIKAYNDMAVVLLKQGNKSEAAQALRQALRLIAEENMDIYTGNIHYNLAVVLSRMDQPQEAADHFDEAIADFKKQLSYEPKNAELYLKIGKSLASMAKIKEAEEYLFKALNLNPTEKMHHLELARNLELQERFDDAITLLQKSIRYMTHRQNKEAVFELTSYMQNIKDAKKNSNKKDSSG